MSPLPPEADMNTTPLKHLLATYRQAVTTDPDSGIVNDANLYASETLHNPQYPLELFQRVITVSLKTMEIVRALPGIGATHD